MLQRSQRYQDNLLWQRAARHFVTTLALLVGVGTSVYQSASAQEDEPLRAIYFQADVSSRVDGLVEIPLGDAHGVVPGLRFAAFRLLGGVFSPVGVLEVRRLFPASCECRQVTGSRTVEVGDIALSLRPLEELPTPANHSRIFHEIRVTRNAERNGYSTLNQQDAVMALLDYKKSHPKWVQRRNADISGAITPHSVTARAASEETDAVDRLYRHLQMLRKLQRRHPQILDVMAEDWRDALQIVSGVRTSDDPEAVTIETTTEETDASIENIKNVIADTFFDRPIAEREILNVLAYAILQENPRNNTQWLTLRLAQTQFPDIASDEDLIIQMNTAIARLKAGSP